MVHFLIRKWYTFKLVYTFDGCTNLSHIYIPIGSRELFERFFPFDRDKLTEIEKNEI